jgi:aquaporin Z
MLELEAARRSELELSYATWRKLFSEAFGTFLLVITAAGGAVVNAVDPGTISRPAQAAAPGLMVMAIVLFMGAVSGAHLNPVVTIGFALHGDFPWRRVPGYVLAQLAGASLACLFFWAALGKVGGLGATVPGPGTAAWQALLVEIVITVGLISAILGTASRARNVSPLCAISVGGYIVVAGLWSSPISGCSMNPARSFGPDLVLNHWTAFWVYVVGPLVGACISVVFNWILHGRKITPREIIAARGAEEP